jgi:hypothetical protein
VYTLPPPASLPSTNPSPRAYSSPANPVPTKGTGFGPFVVIFVVIAGLIGVLYFLQRPD